MLRWTWRARPLRVGADDVQLFCLESREEMPAWEKEVQEALEEGIVINPSWSPKQLIRENGRVTGVEFVHCEAVFDEDGRFNPRCDVNFTQSVDADSVVVSIGQAPDMSFLSQDSQLERALWGSLTVDENTLATNIPSIFAGGDFTTGPTYVIRAISSGRRAALAIDKYLQGEAGRITIIDEKNRNAGSYRAGARGRVLGRTAPGEAGVRGAEGAGSRFS